MTIYYQDDHVTLYHGDCREVLPTLEAVDHIITDPPYSERTHANARSARRLANGGGGHWAADSERVVNLGFAHLDDSLREFCAVEFARLAHRWVLVFSDVESDHLWRTSLTTAGLDYVRTGAWIKIGSTPQFSGDRPAAGFESVTIAHPQGRKRWNGGGRHAVWTHPIVQDRGRTGGVRFHPTQKPDSLMQELVGLFCDAGETVLDPFAGSGGTLLAARMHGVAAVGIELEERYCEVIAKRLDQGVLDFGNLT